MGSLRRRAESTHATDSLSLPCQRLDSWLCGSQHGVALRWRRRWPLRECVVNAVHYTEGKSSCLGARAGASWVCEPGTRGLRACAHPLPQSATAHARRRPTSIGCASSTSLTAARIRPRSAPNMSSRSSANPPPKTTWPRRRRTKRWRRFLLYREVLERDLPWLDDLERARRPGRLPAVLGRDEVRAVLDRMQSVPGLMATLLYGASHRGGTHDSTQRRS